MKEMKWKLNIGETIKDDKRNLLIIDRAFIKKGNLQPNGILAKKKKKWYKYHCNKCGAENWFTENSYRNGKGCYTCCSFSKPILGINTIWDTDRWMCDLGVSEEDAKKYAPQSNEPITVTCPHCKEKKKIQICKIYNSKSIGCKKCGDGVSFPERVASLVFDKLNICYEKQKSFNWSQDKIYDFFIPSLRKLIETHGGQHYGRASWRKYGGRTLAEEQENDRKKEELAIKNGLEYIPIDCRESDIDFIKENMIKMLGDIFDFSSIDWEEIDKEAQISLVWEVCEYWKNKKDEETTADLAKYFGLSGTTIRTYLKKGFEYGWCFYDTKEELSKAGKKSGANTAINKSKKVAVYKDCDLKGVYSSVTELDRKSEQDFGVKFDFRCISAVCLGRQKTHRGYTFKYLE